MCWLEYRFGMNKNHLYTSVAVVVSLAVVALFFVFGGSLFARPSGEASQQVNQQANQQGGAGLVVQDQEVGTGATVQPGDTIVVNYVGKLQDGTVFDSANGVSFQIGVGRVIPGWDQGLQGMKVGGKRLLIIPPALAYGASGSGPIPPNATLIFQVELVKVGQTGSTSNTVVPEGANAN